MATKKQAETVRLVSPSGAIVSVSAEKAERLLGDSSYSKATAKKSTAKSDDSE